MVARLNRANYFQNAKFYDAWDIKVMRKDARQRHKWSDIESLTFVRPYMTILDSCNHNGSSFFTKIGFAARHSFKRLLTVMPGPTFLDQIVYLLPTSSYYCG